MWKKILQKIFQKEIEELANKKSDSLQSELAHYKNVVPAYRLKLNEFRAVNSELHLVIAELNEKIKNETGPTNYTVH